MKSNQVEHWLQAWIDAESEQDKSYAAEQLLQEARNAERNPSLFGEIEDELDWIKDLAADSEDGSEELLLLRLTEAELLKESQAEEPLPGMSQNPYAHYLPMDQPPPSVPQLDPDASRRRVKALFDSLDLDESSGASNGGNGYVE